MIEIKNIRRWIAFFIAALFVSGLTAIPVEAELNFLSRFIPPATSTGHWMTRVSSAVTITGDRYPFLLYGYDWLAFAHFVLAILFIGPYRDPIRNKWVIDFGIIACLLVLPYALIAGHFREIPIGWRLIDCSFGITGLIPLLICRNRIRRIQRTATTIQSSAIA